MPPRPLGLNAGVAPCGVWGGLFTLSFDNVRILFGFYGVFCARDFYEREKKAASLPLSSTLSVFLYVVETQRENLDDYLKEDFRPVFFFAFSFHFR